MLTELTWRFSVTDLKEFSYCPRVSYYEHVLADIRPRTHSQDAGLDDHDTERQRAARRTLAAYNVTAGERRFDVPLHGRQLPLSARLDELVVSSEGEVFPVDYKASATVNNNHKVQLTAYGLLLEEIWERPVTRGFIWLIPKRKAIEVRLTAALRATVHQQLQRLHDMVTAESLPPPTSVRTRCAICQFRRFCNDV